MVVGVRYGAPAYDVKINGTCLRNLSADRLRLADAATAASIVPLRRLVMEMPELSC